ECVEGDAAVGVVAASFDHFDRAVEGGSDAFGLGNGVLLARGEEGPGWAAPYAVESCEDLEGIALGGDGGGRVGRSLCEGGENGEEGREEQGGASRHRSMLSQCRPADQRGADGYRSSWRNLL